MKRYDLIRDDALAVQFAQARGIIIPPLYERMIDHLKTEFRLMIVGFVVIDCEKMLPSGFVLIVPSFDMHDYEIIAEGGWNLAGLRQIFRMIFDDMRQQRVSARCAANQERNIRALKAMGFREEGRKRIASGDYILFGMMREECRVLKKEASYGLHENAKAA